VAGLTPSVAAIAHASQNFSCETDIVVSLQQKNAHVVPSQSCLKTIVAILTIMRLLRHTSEPVSVIGQTFGVSRATVYRVLARDEGRSNPLEPC
jgi:hypothetical protein